MNEHCSPGAAAIRQDYLRFLAEYGFTADAVRRVSEHQEDLVPMPANCTSLRLGPSEIEGKGLFATRALRAGELIAPVRIDGRRTPAGRFLNHSPYPNAAFVRCDGDGLDVVATRDVREGEEVTIDYRQAGQVNGTSFKPLSSAGGSQPAKEIPK